MTQWLELRVHGVHGTTPASLLGLKEVDQVAGDGLTGFYRAPAGTSLPFRAQDDSVVVEAYSWGALTSGVAGFLGWVKRVLWLLLIPFALVNLAYWARLTLTDTGPRGRFTAAAVRLSALVLTVFLVCSVSFVCVDLFSWQCFRGGVTACPSLPGWLQSLASLRPGIRLAIGMLIPLGAVLVLWALARTTLARYEATDDPSVAQAKAAVAAAKSRPPVLSEPGFWSGTRRTTELRNLHVAAALTTVTTLVAGHASREARLTSSAGWRVTFLVIGVLGIAVLLLSAWGCVRVKEEALKKEEERSAGWAWLFPASGALSLVTLALLVLQPRSAYDEFVDFSFHDQMFVILFVALTVLHLGVFFADRIVKRWWLAPAVAFVAVVGGYAVTLFSHRSQHLDLSSTPVRAAIVILVLLGAAATWWHFRGSPHRDHADKAWNGAGASVMMASAAWIALLFTTAGVTGVATYLNGGESVARLTTSVEPFADTAPSAVELLQLTLQGPVDISPLRVPGQGNGYVVSATSAWRTPSGVADPEERFYVASGTYGPTTVRLPAGTRVSHGGHRSSILPLTRSRPVDVLVLELSGKEHSALVLPPVLIWAPIAQFVWLVVAGLLLVGCWLTFRRKVAKPLDKPGEDELFTSRDFRRPDVTWSVPTADRRPVVAARTSAALAHRAESLLNWIGVVTAPIALVLVGLSSTQDYVALTRGSTTLSKVLAYATNLSLLVVLGFSAALVLLGSKVRADEGWRKNVGIIWDLTTFWPRAAHPLAPPCYAERVIPELLTRVHWARPRANVVISAHSQGSLIAVAMLMRLTDLSRIHLVTYGSQVRGLYGRVFPQVFGPDAIPYKPTAGPTRLTNPFPDLPGSGESPIPVKTGLHLSPLVDEGRWVNLFRRADPLGYRVFSDTVGDARDRVVIEVPSAAYGDAGPAVLGHSGYQHSPEYRSLISAWTGATWVGAPTPPKVSSPLPGH